jgi:hypothetical protein
MYKNIIKIVLLFPMLAFAVVTITPDNSNIRYTGVIEQIDGSSGMELYRLKKSYIGLTGVGLWSESNAGTQPGITIQFKTASPTVSLGFTINANYEDRWGRVVLMRDGVEVNSVAGGPDVALSISGTTTEIGEALWTCILPGFKTQYFTGIELDNNFTLISLDADTRPVYVAIGNSITHGAGQTTTTGNLSYPYLVANNLGYQLYNMGVGGSKINTQILDNLTGITPDLVTILWGYNDVNTTTDIALLMKRYDTLITQLVKTYPNAKIVAIEQTYTTTTTGKELAANTIARLRSEQLSILQTIQESNSNLFIVNGLDYTDENSLADVVHLNDDGASSLATGLISEIPTFVVENSGNSETTIGTLVYRTEYEKVGDILATISGISKTISSDSRVKVSATGVVTIAQAINDEDTSIDTILVTAELTSGDTLNMIIVDGFDYLVDKHGGVSLSEHQGFYASGEWSAYNNLWGKGTAVPNEDFRMATLYTNSLPDSTLFVWDAPSEAKEFGGSSVWCYNNLMWGNRSDKRTDLPNFPFRIDSNDSLILSFDYTTISGADKHKMALNLFTTEEADIQPFTENDGDFFMVFDQKGTWVPPYPDTLVEDTTLMDASYMLLHKTEDNYTYRRAIILDKEVVDSGRIDLNKLFDRFNADGYMDLSLSIPNIQFGVEVTDGFGAVLVNQLSISYTDEPSAILEKKQLVSQNQITQKVQANSLVLQTNGENISSVIIANVQGRIITQYNNLNKSSVSVGLSPLGTGIYFTKITTVSGASIVKKFAH